MSSFHNNALVGASGQAGYQIERSLRFNSADSAYLNRTPASAGNRKTWSVSLWLKRSALGTYQMPFSCYQSTGGALALIFNTDNTLEFYQYNAAYQMRLITSQVFRDPSSWYHFVFSVDTTQATASNRVKIYVNGAQITAFSTATYPTQNDDLIFNYAQSHAIGMYAGNNQYYFDGLITEFHNVDGQALTPSSFGETDTITGVWKPKRYSGTYGTNGFKLTFSDNSGTTSTTLGKDSSGNGNNWTPNNFSVTAGAGNDSLIDTPTPYADGGNGRGNYCTLNPITSNATGYLISPINGNLDAYLAAGSNAFFGVAGTQAITSGKFYWEVTPTTIQTGAGTWMEIGIIQSTLTYPAGTAVGSYNGGFAYTNDGYKARSNSYSSYGATWTANDVIGVALDADNGSITFYKNGVSQGAAYTDLASYNLPAGYYPAIAIYRSTGTSQYAVFNFGQRAFAYTPPSGFLALNTNSLPEPSIKKPSSYFDTVLFSGTSASTVTVTGLNFQPDLVWAKPRTGAWDHYLWDSVRGATKYLNSNLTASETTDANSLTSFNSNGFSAGAGANFGPFSLGNTEVAWCWDESATPGFDIVTYTGNGTARTIAHSLGVAPSMIIFKNRDVGTTDWAVYFKLLVETNSANYVKLNSTDAVQTSPSPWNGTLATSSVFSVGTWDSVNGNGNGMVAYLWSEVAGFSKFGSYTGNGSSDGPFVFCGFRPRWVMMKSSTNAATPWQIFDSARETFNTIEQTLVANGSNAEPYDTASPVDFLSNGFKLRGGGASYNNYNTGTWIFAAFAETPMKYSLAF